MKKRRKQFLIIVTIFALYFCGCNVVDNEKISVLPNNSSMKTPTPTNNETKVTLTKSPYEVTNYENITLAIYENSLTAKSLSLVYNYSGNDVGTIGN